MVANILKKITRLFNNNTITVAYAKPTSWESLETLAYTLLKEEKNIQHLHDSYNYQLLELFYGMNPDVEEFNYQEVMALVGHQRYYNGRVLLGFNPHEIEKNRKRLQEIEALFLFFKEEIEPTGASIYDLTEEERIKRKRSLEKILAYEKRRKQKEKLQQVYAYIIKLINLKK